MKLYAIAALITLFSTGEQASASEACTCVLKNSQKAFPHGELSRIEDEASKCIGDVSPQKALHLQSLLVGLEQRLPQLEDNMSLLEKEDDGDLYGVISLQLLENELLEIQQLLHRLNSTILGQQRLSNDTAKQLKDLRAEMQNLETFDTMQVVKRQEENKRLKKHLQECTNGFYPTVQPTPAHGYCPHGEFVNISSVRVYTPGEYPGSHKYGAWGRDPKPEPGKESWYWLVMLTSGNKYSNYVRRYSSLSSLIIGVSKPGNVLINSANPTTNTIQGPNVVMYGEALYYNCYNQPAICQFNLTSKSVSKVQLPEGTRFNSKSNFCHLDDCYPFTDLDLVTDESGVWVVYTTSGNFGNLVLSKVEKGDPPKLSSTWQTSVYKQAVTNTFMVCGVLYATRYINKDMEEIFYSFDTTTGKERFNIGIVINKMSPNIYSLNYSPVDQMLHAYCDSNMVSYEVIFQ
ncbi:olfactomedin-4-like [Takifugu flavidus]|uniref:Olfactomedin-4 n=1 Tax=Takifugu flavidus TaxID=433684 RepID=A0A5C6P8T3_9TELE|nr:olfactomedin-4-like [Takifugu flavidus]TWW76122.1 Olfactomedin-4 [Takifugu flavidus]